MSDSAEPLSKDAVLQIHSVAIARFGELDGVRDDKTVANPAGRRAPRFYS